MSKDVFVLMEQRDGELAKVGIELIGEATKLASDLGEKVVAVILGSGIKDKAEVCIQFGADKVVVVDDPMLKEYLTEPYADAVTAVIKKYDPEVFLFGASSIGRDLLQGFPQEYTQDLQPTAQVLTLTLRQSFLE